MFVRENAKNIMKKIYIVESAADFAGEVLKDSEIFHQKHVNQLLRFTNNW